MHFLDLEKADGRDGAERGTVLLPEEVRSGRGACEGGADRV